MTPPRTEMQRILSLTRPTLSPSILPDLGVRLRPAQVDALLEWTRALASDTSFGPPGLAVLAGVGHGKTLIGLLLPYLARYYGHAARALYLVPAALVDQLHADRTMWAGAGAPVPDTALVLSHERLSAPSGKDALRDFAPSILVIDEAHHFADPTSGRWRRVDEYLQYRPDTRVVVMSGSLSWRSLLQCRHLLLAALRGWCPLPYDRSIGHWAAAIDVDGEPCADDLRALRPLVAAYGIDVDPSRLDGVFRDGARMAYRARLSTCPGVVLTSTAGVDASLRCVAWRPTVTVPPAIAAAVRALETAWVLPDGTELVSSLEYARHAATLPLGLYQRWDPATVDPEWVAVRAAWARTVRNLVTYQGRRYQTPGAVVAAAERGDLDGTPEGAIYAAWAAVEDDEGPRTETVTLGGWDSYLRDVVYSYAHVAGSPVLVWVRTPAVGNAIAALTGWRYHGAGSPPPTGATAIASYRVHGTGWSGAPAAGYRSALVLEPPSSGATWEQLLGRLHRAGQTDDVTTHVLCSSSHGFNAISKGIADALYVEETTGQAQRLLLADWVGFSAPRGPRTRSAASTTRNTKE